MKKLGVFQTKQFDTTKKIDDETIHALLESLRLSPSSFGLQPWKFLVITNQAVKESLKEHSWNQSQVADCSHLIVHCARKNMPNEYIAEYIQDIATTRSAPLEALDAYKQMMQGTVASRTPAEIAAWNARQVYITQGFLMLSAAMLGIDSCPMEGFSAAKYDEILKLESSDYTARI